MNEIIELYEKLGICPAVYEYGEKAIARLKGIRCGFKNTSCPDQLACNLERMLEEN